MLSYFLFVIIYKIIDCSTCVEGQNNCERCNPITKLCDKCYYEVFGPDENGDCEGSKKCVVGENYCSECEDVGYLCKSCEESYLPDENGGCSYSPNCQISYEGICLKCIEDYILIGKSNYNIFEGIKICKSNHSEEFKNCEFIDKDNGHCRICKEGYVLTSKDKKCTKIQNCAESKYDVCTKCDSGYYLDKVQNECIKQEGVFMNCKLSVDGKKCDTCIEDNYFDDNGECIWNNFCSKAKDYKCEECKEGYYLAQNFECSTEENCIKAKRHLGVCTLCKDNYYLDYKDGKCKSNLEDDDFKYCRIADGVCNKCIEGYFVGQDNKCSFTDNCAESEDGKCKVCKDKFYLGLDLKCTNVENCIYSNANSQCIECKDDYYFDTNAQICKKGTNELSNCKLGIENMTCDECKDDFYLNKTDGLCYSNLEKNNFYKCAFSDSDVEFCQKCIRGYYLGAEDLKCTTVDGCLKSEDENKCIKCDSNFYCLNKKTGNCELNYEIETEEQKIYYMCNETNKEGTACETCLDGHILNDDGLCVDDLHCVDKKDGVCQKCSNENGELYCLNKYFGCVESMYENCLECNDIFNLYKCTKCYEGYEVNLFNVCVKTDKEK